MSGSLESLSQPVAEDMPSGENLEYDPVYLEIENLVRPKSEAMVNSEDSGLAAEETDWKEVGKHAEELSERTRDLRIQVYAAVSALNTRGFSAFRDNLNVLKIFLGKFWDSVHPQLDPDDNNDPTLRMSTLQMLNDRRLVVAPVDRAKLVEMKGVGSFSIHDVDLALGHENPVEGEDLPDINLVRQAFLTAEPDYLDELGTAVSESKDLLSEMSNIWQEKTGDAAGLEFSDAIKALRRVSSVITEFAPGPSGEGDPEAGSGDEEPGSAMASFVSGAINSRADVIRVLDRICDYYQVNEPSSPIPLLLRRAQRLVEKSFLEILEDMVPDGVNQAKIISGDKDKD